MDPRVPFHCALAVLVFSGRPIFYTQERLGINGHVFNIQKFRTMIVDAERDTGPVWAEKNDPRVTRFGRILRYTSIDEVPQLFNIIRGEMSLVGPRPERPELTKQFEIEIPHFADRLNALPGLAPLSHVLGDSFTSPRRRLKYDLIYIENMSAAFDTYILFMTAIKMLRFKK